MRFGGKFGDLQYGWIKIGTGDGHCASLAFLAHTGASHDQWHTDAAFIMGTFVRTQRAMGGGLGKAAIVGSEDHQCVVSEIQLTQGRHHFTDAFVNGFHHGGIFCFALAFGFVDRSIAGDFVFLALQGSVDVVEREVEKERLLGLTITVLRAATFIPSKALGGSPPRLTKPLSKPIMAAKKAIT